MAILITFWRKNGEKVAIILAIWRIIITFWRKNGEYLGEKGESLGEKKGEKGNL
jgi:hypothetical protein